MNSERFEELVARLLDGELTATEATEFAAKIHVDPGARQQLQQHLVLWELWSQQHAPERCAEAFLRALQTRRRAEAEDDRFVASVNRRLRAEPHRLSRLAASLRRTWFARIASVWPRIRVAAAATAVALVAALWLILMPHSARATVTLHGEAVCRACILHETHAHLPAIRVQEGGRTVVYRVSSDPRSILRLGDYCTAPLPLIATGVVEQREDQVFLRVTEAERDPSRETRLLFPF